MKLIITFCLLLAVVGLYGHQSYISIANLEYNDSKKQIEVSLKVTAHDFEQILSQMFKTNVKLENINDSSAVGIQIQQYISQHFTIWSESKKADFQYVGKEVTVRDELFFYFTFKQVLNPSHIYIKNSVLFELFSGQQNIVHYKYKSTIKSITLTPAKEEDELKFN